MFDSVKKGFQIIWRWLRENILYVVIILILQGCLTLNPAVKQTMLDGVTYAAEKMDCEKQGKDYKCESPMVNCLCVERPKLPPATPVIVPPPSVIVPPVVVPPVVVPPPVVISSSHLLQPGESLDLIVKNSSVAFWIKGLRMFHTNPDRDHIFLFVKWLKNGKESNINVDMTNGATRLITQRFDGGCGQAKCERQDVNPVDWNPATTYKIIMSWNPDFSVHMEAFSPDGSSFAAWDNTLWADPGQLIRASVGSPFGAYPMPDILEALAP
jgi:hypothetical protein